MSRGIHGNQGKAVVGGSTIAELTGWTCKRSLGIVNYIGQSAAGEQRSVRGNKKSSGTIKGKYDPSDPIDSKLQTDSYVTLVLYHNASQRWKTVVALIGDIDYTVEIDGHPGTIQEWSATWESDSALQTI